MRYLIKYSYDGSHFNGFQRLKDKESVQSALERALTILNKSSVVVKGSGRTDVGVHANGGVAHFDLDVSIPENRLVKALNRIVHPYIHVLDCQQVSNDFHARFSVKEKKYVYKIWCGPYDPKKYDYYLIYDKKISLKRLKECAKIFVGCHDFHNFVSGERENSNGTIYQIKVKKRKNLIEITFRGKSFYRYMVRNLVGAFLLYNEGKCAIIDLKKMLEKDYYKKLATAPANGLYLEGVYYE